MRNGFWNKLPLFFVVAALVTGASFATGRAFADSFDWRNVQGFNWNSPIRNQFGGTCWAFGATGAFEAKYKLTRNDPFNNPDLSEQQLVWETNPDLGDSIDGGSGGDALEYAIYHGQVTELECPHQPSSPDVGIPPYWPLAGDYATRAVRGTGYSENITDRYILGFIKDTPSVGYIKNQLKLNGPLECGLNTNTDLFASVPDMIANYNDPSDDTNHVVVIVGYQDDASVPNGGYWIIKNSWGTGFGDAGYGYAPYGSIESYISIDRCEGPVYANGPWATATWKGGNNTWTNGGTNWTSGGGDYAWESLETAATFNSSTGTTVTINGPVVAHGLTISAGATGYVFNGTNGGSLTVTRGGMSINENTTINAPVTVGAPQSWNLVDWRTLTINGDLHTIINSLSINGYADVYVSGSVDGGGALNLMGSAPGSITLNGGAWLHLTGGGKTYAVNTGLPNGAIIFETPGGTASTYSSVISGAGGIDQWNTGTAILSGTNTYTGWTTVSNGAIQANSGAGLSAASLLNLNGGVLQSNSAVTFTRSLGTSGSNRFQWNTNGGGFAAGAGPMTLRINNGTGTLTWGTTVGSQIVGTLKFGSTTAANVVTLQNGINLNGATRTIQCEDNPLTGADYAAISGVISNGSGTPGITKTGPGTLKLTGANTYSGLTTVQGGALMANSGTGLPAASMLTLDGGVLESVGAVTFSRSLNSAAGSNRFYWTAGGGGFSANGGVMNVRINNGTGTLTWGTTVGSQIVGTLKLSSATANNYTNFQNGINLNGADRTIQVDDNPDTAADYGRIAGVISGSGAGIVKTGIGLLYLPATNTYTGTTTISGGALDAAQGVGLPNNSFLSLDGGVYMSSAAATFTRALGTSGSTFQWTANGGGFAADAGALVVNIGNGAALTWGTTVGTNLVGTLKLSNSMAASSVTMQNAINLNGAVRTIQVDDNPYSGNDYAELTGVISGGSGSGLTINNSGLLQILGSAGNTYSGVTTINGGWLNLAKSSGTAIPGDITFTGSKSAFVQLLGAGQIGSSSKWTWSTTDGYQEIVLLGHNQTVAKISDSTGRGVIENSWDQTGWGNSTLTVNNTSSCSFNGYMRDTALGDGTLALLKSGSATLTLSGPNITYTGGTTISAGKLVLDNLPAGAFLGYNITNNATLELKATTTNVNYSGVISGSGALTANVAAGRSLTLSGSSGNTYTGTTTVSAGTLKLDKSSGYAISGPITFTGSTYADIHLLRDNQINPSSVITWSSLSDYHELKLMGHAVTVAGISDSSGLGAIENVWGEWGYGPSTFTVNNSANYSFNGWICDNGTGETTSTLALVKGGSGTLTLSGPNSGLYTGGLTVNAGTLDLTNGVLPNCTITVNGGTLILPGGGIYGGAMASLIDTSSTSDRSLAISKEPQSVSLASIANNSLLQVPVGGVLTLDSIRGTGTTFVTDFSELTVNSIVQDTLIIGGSPTAAAVPEPGTVVLLLSAGIGILGFALRRKS